VKLKKIEKYKKRIQPDPFDSDDESVPTGRSHLQALFGVYPVPPRENESTSSDSDQEMSPIIEQEIKEQVSEIGVEDQILVLQQKSEKM
jgi:hypothetical protein